MGFNKKIATQSFSLIAFSIGLWACSNNSSKLPGHEPSSNDSNPKITHENLTLRLNSSSEGLNYDVTRFPDGSFRIDNPKVLMGSHSLFVDGDPSALCTMTDENNSAVAIETKTEPLTQETQGKTVGGDENQITWKTGPIKERLLATLCIAPTALKDLPKSGEMISNGVFVKISNPKVTIADREFKLGFTGPYQVDITNATHGSPNSVEEAYTHDLYYAPTLQKVTSLNFWCAQGISDSVVHHLKGEFEKPQAEGNIYLDFDPSTGNFSKFPRSQQERFRVSEIRCVSESKFLEATTRSENLPFNRLKVFPKGESTEALVSRDIDGAPYTLAGDRSFVKACERFGMTTAGREGYHTIDSNSVLYKQGINFLSEVLFGSDFHNNSRSAVAWVECKKF